MTGFTQEEDDRLKQLRHDGFTFSEIALTMNRTRNSVIGRASRMGFGKANEKRVKKYKKKRPGTGAGHKKVVDKKRGDWAKDSFVHPAPKGVVDAVVSLNKRQCKYPIGDVTEPNFHFCDKSVVGKSSYCEDHSTLCFVDPKPRRGTNVWIAPRTRPAWSSGKGGVRQVYHRK